MEQTTDSMTHYETVYVIHPVHASRNQELRDRFQGVLESQGAKVTHFEEWGLRDLAYPIQKQGRGVYNLIQFLAAPGTTQELERVMGLADEVMRCMTVVLDDDVQPIVVEPRVEPATETGTEAPQGEASAEEQVEEADGSRASSDPAQS